MKLSPAKKTLLVALPLGMLLGIAGTVLAADPRLDDASAHCDQAIALLTAAENPAMEKREFGGHRRKAIEQLNKVKKEIKAAKDFADRDTKPAPSGGGPKDPKPAPSGGAPKGPKPAPSGGYKK